MASQGIPRHMPALAERRARAATAVGRRPRAPVVVTEEEPELNGPTDARIGAADPFLKPTFGLAGTPEILRAVLDTGRRTAVLVGFETDVCVYQSAVGLLDRSLRALVVEDAVISPGEMHARGLDRMRDAGARLTHCKALGYEWVRTVEAANVLPRPAPFPL